MARQYKTHILSLMEFHTGSIFHAKDSAFRQLEDIQRSFLQQIGLTENDAFLDFNLAPLRLRRDIAILGFLHKANLGRCHPSIRKFFRNRSVSNGRTVSELDAPA